MDNPRLKASFLLIAPSSSKINASRFFFIAGILPHFLFFIGFTSKIGNGSSFFLGDCPPRINRGQFIEPPPALRIPSS
jgi:hypothetical protein